VPATASRDRLLIAASRGITQAAVGRWLVHALRNPLQSLTMVPALADMDDGRLDDLSGPLLVDGTRDLTALVALLDELLARPGDGVPVPVALAEPLGLMARLAACHRTTTEVRIAPPPDDLPAVAATADGVLHVALTLLLDALEACDGHAGRTVELRAAAAGEWVTVTVTDDASEATESSGGAPDDRDTAARENARAIGVAAGRALAAEWGGELRVSERTGGGTVAELRLRPWGAAKR
jgi:signal transduction histidine kinase